MISPTLPVSVTSILADFNSYYNAYCKLLAAIYEDELIEEPYRREEIISNIEKQTDNLLENILGQK